MDVLILGRAAALARGRWRLKMPDGKELTGMTTVVFRKLPEGWPDRPRSFVGGCRLTRPAARRPRPDVCRFQTVFTADGDRDREPHVDRGLHP